MYHFLTSWVLFASATLYQPEYRGNYFSAENFPPTFVEFVPSIDMYNFTEDQRDSLHTTRIAFSKMARESLDSLSKAYQFRAGEITDSLLNKSGVFFKIRCSFSYLTDCITTKESMATPYTICFELLDAKTEESIDKFSVKGPNLSIYRSKAFIAKQLRLLLAVNRAPFDTSLLNIQYPNFQKVVVVPRFKDQTSDSSSSLSHLIGKYLAISLAFDREEVLKAHPRIHNYNVFYDSYPEGESLQDIDLFRVVATLKSESEDYNLEISFWRENTKIVLDKQEGDFRDNEGSYHIPFSKKRIQQGDYTEIFSKLYKCVGHFVNIM